MVPPFIRCVSWARFSISLCSVFFLICELGVIIIIIYSVFTISMTHNSKCLICTRYGIFGSQHFFPPTIKIFIIFLSFSLPRKYDWVLIFFFLYKYCIFFYIGTHGIISNPLNMNKFQNLIDFRWISSLILPRNHSPFSICGVVFFSAQIFKYYMFDYFLPSSFISSTG